MEDVINEKTHKIFDADFIDHWGDKERYDDSLIKKLISIPGFSTRVASQHDAARLFYIFLGREGGNDLVGKTCEQITNELFNSEEYKIKRITYELKIKERIDIKGENGSLIIRLDDNPGYGQGAFSCCLEYLDGNLYITLPSNFHASTFFYRVVPYFPIFQEVIKILHNSLSQTKSIEFFYGDHPSREFGVAFCSNRSDDYLVPDFDMLKIFSAPPHQSIASWSSRLAMAYFRGTDTGSSYYKSADKSQRAVLSILSLEHPTLINAKLTGAENELNIKKYKSIGIWGDREPQSNILQYKYNVDIDGNSNSWVGLVNKLYMGAGGVVLKLASPEGYRQWFYDRLQPWVNFVPIAADVSDLVDKIVYLNKNDDFAESIYKNSIYMFSGLDFSYLKQYAAHVFSKALLGLR